MNEYKRNSVIHLQIVHLFTYSIFASLNNVKHYIGIEKSRRVDIDSQYGAAFPKTLVSSVYNKQYASI